jgi:hypothetical protein
LNAKGNKGFDLAPYRAIRISLAYGLGRKVWIVSAKFNQHCEVPMRLVFLVLVTALPLAATTGCTTPTATIATIQSPQSAVEELLAADRAFANLSAQGGGVAPLAAMFAQDVVMTAVPQPGFAATPAEAIARLEKSIGTASQNGRIAWTPVRGGISADGQHGFTLGYFTAAQDGASPFQAKYVAYWLKDASGWRVKVYKFIPREGGEIPATIFAPLTPAVLVAPTAPNPEAAVSLAAIEKSFSDESQTTGLRTNFKKYGRADAMHSLAANDFVVGNEAIGEAHPDGPSPLHWKADHSLIASSGDLGINYGYLERNGPTPPGRLAKIPFFTIWYRESPQAPWRYVAE